ncbi:hypothetical protein HG536_0G04860 [Torulaspora globosa]|uniref:acid phosphatase n=1 Tax=Torulaspora globosa TaxID=48254 RepID=A0A7G3ZM88_9SACH|nr:uncharacterized protein HG536_0G04860 [Torulaspora globosa]QLL34624.1 hypothetical protein HG536_0G04860 [Torulaspora globosa]
MAMGSALVAILASVAALGQAAVVGRQYAVAVDKIGTQEDIFRFLGGAGPYFSFPFDNGIPEQTPDCCKLMQVQLFARHGERFPTKKKGNKILETYYKLANYTGTFNESLSFLNDDYEFFVRDPEYYEEETTLKNSLNPLNPYTGERDAQRHSQNFLALYKNLLNETSSFAVFTSNSKRCHDTAQFFIDGLGNDYNVSLQVIDEAPSSGANSLTPRYGCANFSESENDGYVRTYSREYLSNLAKRLNIENKGLNLTNSDAENLFFWCAYELNVRGYSDICSIFTEEELIHFSYQDDLESYYENGNGNSLGAVAGSILFNASVELLKQSDDLEQKAWLSFTHDSDLINYIAAVGLFDNGVKLNTSYVPFRDHVYRKSWIAPQGARIYTQKFSCYNQSYVRYVVNDAVIPIESCSSGPGFSCPLEQFYDYAESRLSDINFSDKCGKIIATNATSLTFYWDYKTRNYNASLVKK